MLKSVFSRILLAAAVSVSAFSAQAVVIDFYSVSGVQPSGFGQWTYNFANGNGTLNDGILSGDSSNNELFQLSDNPIINLHLSAPTNVTGINIFGGDYFNNFIPGTLTGWTVTIGSSSVALNSTDFGAQCTSGLCDDAVSLIGTGLELNATSVISLSNFTGGWTGYFNIAEITVDGTPGSQTNVPEPSAIILFGMGLLGLGLARRKSAR